MPTQRFVKDELDQACQLQHLLEISIPHITAFLRRAEVERDLHRKGLSLEEAKVSTSLINPSSASHEALEKTLGPAIAVQETGIGPEGLQTLIAKILQYSVNPSAPGYLDKLYAAPLPPGITAELILGVLNTNVHVYQVSPVLTLIEKHVTKDLARLFGLNASRSGGISVQGGSASNLTSIVIARNTLFPETKVHGNGAVNGRLLLFTSAHGHYSIEKAAQALGLGSCNVLLVPVDDDGRMSVSELDSMIIKAKQRGDKPFYINATAGTTVLGSFDPFEDIAEVAKQHNLWFHVDAAWGGGFVFSDKPQLTERLRGIGLADSVATNPHKMLGVPITCSFLLARDLKQFQKANTLKARYLFHDDDLADEDTIASMKSDDEAIESRDSVDDPTNRTDSEFVEALWDEPFDLADLTLQCGRRGDSLKFFLTWQYYGTGGYMSMVNRAYETACYTSQLVEKEPNLRLVLTRGNGPSCLQVCFYFTPAGRFAYGLCHEQGYMDTPRTIVRHENGALSLNDAKVHLGKLNSRITAKIVKDLISQGFMVDYAPALEGQEDHGKFFRVVVNISTIRETVERLVRAIVATGQRIVLNSQTDHANGIIKA
ncbi:Glutamate decarboxylase 2 [Neophaeococcomyces mojaviensis]|uniref:Glutamate decarboxylase 2 n=1 Tax=Neophaeococcomyces mojaviensis TaxID=3383035 RepID=A0ACC3A7K4_9EURO|nr:Glutamate decarboxylase 2 [Knufia sp. JES_112]